MDIGTRKPEQKDDRIFYLRVLQSEECQCERPKKKGRAFCFKCFIGLPRELAEALYNPIGNGFEKAYDDCCQYLNK